MGEGDEAVGEGGDSAVEGGDVVAEEHDAAMEKTDALGGRCRSGLVVLRPQRSRDSVSKSKQLGINETRARMSNGSSVV